MTFQIHYQVPSFADASDDFTEEQFNEMVQGAKDMVMDVIRKQRDALLLASDWTQNASAPLSTEKKAAWETYRQALRDVTNGISFDTDFTFTETNFPAKPE